MGNCCDCCGCCHPVGSKYDGDGLSPLIDPASECETSTTVTSSEFVTEECEPPPTWSTSTSANSLTADSTDFEHAASTTETAQRFGPADMTRCTGGFCDSNKLDEGTFGCVFRGSLDNGTAVAIKVLKISKLLRDRKRAGRTPPGSQSYTGEASFLREAEVLSAFRHPNIVALLGHSVGNLKEVVSRFRAGDGNGVMLADMPCLVYEFMEGQSLKRRLRSHEHLDITSRLNIASDVARGLVFLHTKARPPIVHQDIKTDNILLGFEGPRLVAKLADFGTVRMDQALEKHSHVSTRTVVGTTPYMPPERYQEGHVSVKTDSFAFGVVLLELLTGLPPKNKQTKEPLCSELGAELEEPERLMIPYLDKRAGDWDITLACKVADVARRLLAWRARDRCTVVEAKPELDRLAGRRVRKKRSHV